MVRKTVYWIQDKDDPSIEFEWSLSFSKSYTTKMKRKFEKENTKRRYILKQQTRNFTPNEVKFIKHTTRYGVKN